MPSLRTIFVVAAASFATLVFAAPTGIISRSGLDPLTNNAAKEPLSALPTTADVSGTSTPIESGSDVLQTLPVILSAAKEKLDTVFCNLNSTISGSGLIDADLVAPFIGQTHDILVELLASAKTLIGHPEEIILGVDGTVKEVADLLHAILTLVIGILACILKSVGPAALELILPLIQPIVGLLGELLPCILSLVQGLFVILASVLNGVLELLPDLGLGDIAQLLSAI